MRSPTDNQSRSVVHRWPAGIKLTATLLIVLTTALMPRRPHWGYLVTGCLVLFVWALSRMPLLAGLKRLVIAEIFILGIAIFTLLQPSMQPVFLSTLIKSNICVTATLILAWTTPFGELLSVLRRIRFPSVMLTTLALLQRYVPVIAGESRRMQRARASRTFLRRGRLAFDWKNLSIVAGQLFVRSADRAERIYLAMCARGWK